MEKSFKKPVKSSTLRCGKRTFFFDCFEASNNKKYLRITESAFVGEGERKRNMFLLFADDIQNFQDNLKEMSGYMA